MMRYRLLIVLLLAVPVFAQETSIDPLNEVKNLYDQGMLDEAELVALRHVSRSSSLSEIDLAELHRYLAYISVARGDREAGKEQFINALSLNPRLRVDPTLTSPKILAVFNQARDDFNALGQQRFHSTDEMLMACALRNGGARRSLFFPGLGQLYKGQKTRGWTYIGITGVLIVGLGVAQSEVNRLDDDYHNSHNPDALSGIYDEYKNAVHMRNYVGIALGTVWVVNVLDAFFTPPELETQTVIEPTLLETGMGIRPGISLQLRF